LIFTQVKALWQVQWVSMNIMGPVAILTNNDSTHWRGFFVILDVEAIEHDTDQLAVVVRFEPIMADDFPVCGQQRTKIVTACDLV
jgi:hypothetical protein